jgi:hypothetical protein
MRSSTAFAFVFVCLSSAAALASPDLYECKFSGTSNAGGWIPPEVVVLHEPGQGDATVIDGIIQHFLKEPLAAEVAADTDKRLSFGWTYLTKSGAQTARMHYRLTFFRQSGKASITAQAAGYIGPDTGSGTCKRGKAG